MRQPLKVQRKTRLIQIDITPKITEEVSAASNDHNAVHPRQDLCSAGGGFSQGFTQS